MVMVPMPKGRRVDTGRRTVDASTWVKVDGRHAPYKGVFSLSTGYPPGKATRKRKTVRGEQTKLGKQRRVEWSLPEKRPPLALASHGTHARAQPWWRRTRARGRWAAGTRIARPGSGRRAGRAGRANGKGEGLCALHTAGVSGTRCASNTRSTAMARPCSPVSSALTARLSVPGPGAKAGASGAVWGRSGAFSGRKILAGEVEHVAKVLGAHFSIATPWGDRRKGNREASAAIGEQGTRRRYAVVSPRNHARRRDPHGAPFGRAPRRLLPDARERDGRRR